jgi:ABC-2 type transport system permease protein
MKKLLKYDFFYLFKTSKFIVFGAIFVLFSIISPLTARYINEILGFLLNGQDLGLVLPEPSVWLAYEQYISDLYEIVFTIVLFVVVSIFMRDKTKGLQALIFSKPINRTKYLMSKYISVLALILTSITLGYLAFSYYTYFIFDEIFFGTGIVMMLLYFLDLAFVAAIALFSATHFKSYIMGILCTYGIYIFVSILAIFDKVIILKYFPGVIKSNIARVLVGTYDTTDIILNVLVTLVLMGTLITLSILKIRNQDI